MHKKWRQKAQKSINYLTLKFRVGPDEKSECNKFLCNSKLHWKYFLSIKEAKIINYNMGLEKTTSK